jgi:hypothetical protein
MGKETNSILMKNADYNLFSRMKDGATKCMEIKPK